MPSALATTGNWKSTRARCFRKKSASGTIRLRCCGVGLGVAAVRRVCCAVDVSWAKDRLCAARCRGRLQASLRSRSVSDESFLSHEARQRTMSLGEMIRESQVWKSIFRHPMPLDRRNRIVVMLTNFFLHLHPVSIKKQGIALSYTWCMGGVTFFLFLVETVTGVLLMFYYRPTLEWAYNDILALRDVTSLGILRELHRWGAHAMVITVWLHMYRVFLTGSYKPPREFNWVVGVILLLLTLLLSFTGYLLPWDQLAIWAITVGSNMARATPILGHEGPGQQLLNVRRHRHDYQRLAMRALACSVRALRGRGNA